MEQKHVDCKVLELAFRIQRTDLKRREDIVSHSVGCSQDKVRENSKLLWC